MKIEIRKIYFYIILLFPLSTLFQSYFDAINKLLFGILLVLQIILTFKGIKAKNFIIILIMLISFCCNIISTHGRPYNINEIFYYPFSVLFLLYMADNVKMIEYLFRNHKRFISRILNIWTFLVGISIFLPSSYKSSWGGAHYFSSFCGSIWRLAPTCIFIMSLALGAMIIYKKKKFILYALIPMYSLYMGGSRTYVLVGLALFMIFWYHFSASKKIFYISLPCVAIVLVSLIWQTSMADKLNTVSYTTDSYFDFWGTITSGRSIFWSADIKAFWESNIVKKTIGHGLNFIYEINDDAFGGLVWAHNDFIQCLVSHGIIGLILYLYSIKKLFYNIHNKTIGYKETIPVICCFFVWLINAVFNMFYTYFCSILALPILIYAVQQGEKRFLLKKPNEKESSKITNYMRKQYIYKNI